MSIAKLTNPGGAPWSLIVSGAGRQDRSAPGTRSDFAGTLADHTIRLQQAEQKAATRTVPAPAAEEGEVGFFGEDGFTVDDMLDIVNPLHHIPVVSTLYRAFSDDDLSPGARLAGGTLYGGPIGFAAALANNVAVENSGRDIGGNLLAMVRGDDETGPTPIRESLAARPDAPSRSGMTAATDGVQGDLSYANANENTGRHIPYGGPANVTLNGNNNRDAGTATPPAPESRLRPSQSFAQPDNSAPTQIATRPTPVPAHGAIAHGAAGFPTGGQAAAAGAIQPRADFLGLSNPVTRRTLADMPVPAAVASPSEPPNATQVARMTVSDPAIPEISSAAAAQLMRMAGQSGSAPVSQPVPDSVRGEPRPARRDAVDSAAGGIRTATPGVANVASVAYNSVTPEAIPKAMLQALEKYENLKRKQG